MRKLTFPGLIAASLFIAAQAPAHQGATGIVKERMDAFKASQQHLKSVITAAKTDEFEQVEKLARQLAEWGRAMPDYFPADSAHPPSEAAPAIWQDFSGFSAAADRFSSTQKEIVDHRCSCVSKNTMCFLMHQLAPSSTALSGS